MAAHGVCSIVRDGYYPVAIGCLALGVASKSMSCGSLVYNFNDAA